MNNWRRKFEAFGIRELMAVREILEAIDSRATIEHWDMIDELNRQKKSRDKAMQVILAELDLEIGKQENQLEKEYKEN